jgi:uncharacterized protein YeaO (DUF488 family)
MPVRTKRVYDPASEDDGTRILVMRLYPRGIRRQSFHEWRKELGTALPLIKAWKAGRISWPELARRFKAQMAGDPVAQASLRELARRARTERLTLLCGCEDEAQCHRTLLKAMIERPGTRRQ